MITDDNDMIEFSSPSPCTAFLYNDGTRFKSSISMNNLIYEVKTLDFAINTSYAR